MAQYLGWILPMIAVGCSCATPIPIDTQMSAIEGNDLTALVSGCGQQQVAVGYIACRFTEGTSTREEWLEIHGPPNVKCAQPHACTHFTLFYPDGRPTYEGSIPKGQSFSKINLSKIVDKPTFEVSDRGFYGLSITQHFTGPDGSDHKTYAEGILFIRVVRKIYTPLMESEEDENFAWQWNEKNNQTIKMTTGYRVFLSPRQSEKR